MSTPKAPKTPKTSTLAIDGALVKLKVAAADVGQVLSAETRVITSDDKKRSVRLRNGGERVVRAIFEIVKQHGLDSEKLHSDEMLAHLQRYESLAPVETVLTPLATRAADVRFLAASDAWTMALAFYSVLARLALTDHAIAASIAPLEEFFARRSNAAVAGKPTKLQTRAAQKLAHAERLVKRAKPRASVLEAEVSPPPEQPAQASNGVANGASNGANGVLFLNGQSH
jgi:hypothetical protein